VPNFAIPLRRLLLALLNEKPQPESDSLLLSSHTAAPDVSRPALETASATALVPGTVERKSSLPKQQSSPNLPSCTSPSFPPFAVETQPCRLHSIYAICLYMVTELCRLRALTNPMFIQLYFIPFTLSVMVRVLLFKWTGLHPTPDNYTLTTLEYARR
jgi:hypothetical protein